MNLFGISREQAIRVTALTLAVASSGKGAPITSILAKAEQYKEYVTRGRL